LQKIFNLILEEGQTAVDRRQFMVSVMNTPELIGLFTQEQMNELGYQGNDTTIAWHELLEFIQKTEGGDSASNGSDGKSPAGFTEEMPEFHPAGELVEKQSKALEVDLDANGVKVSMMETDDIRVVMSSSNKLIVSSTVDAIDLVTEYATKHQLPDTAVPILLDHVERAVIKASQQELRLLEEMSVECMNQLEQMAEVLLTMELQMMIAMEDCKRAQFISGAASAGRRGSVQQDLRMALQSTAGGSPGGKGGKQIAIDLPTPGELAKKLSGLQHRVTKKEEEVCCSLSRLHIRTHSS
jgi:hypothetical protein